jgi:cytochrome c oxidase subunit 4
MDATSHHAEDHDRAGIVMHKPHVCSAQTFGGILLALFFLTFITVLVAQFDFGGANMWIAMAVASVKASLVISVFMHLLWDTTVNKIMFLSSFLFLGLLFLFAFADLLARADVDLRNDRPAPLSPADMPELNDYKFFKQFEGK